MFSDIPVDYNDLEIENSDLVERSDLVPVEESSIDSARWK